MYRVHHTMSVHEFRLFLAIIFYLHIVRVCLYDSVQVICASFGSSL